MFILYIIVAVARRKKTLFVSSTKRARGVYCKPKFPLMTWEKILWTLGIYGTLTVEINWNLKCVFSLFRIFHFPISYYNVTYFLYSSYAVALYSCHGVNPVTLNFRYWIKGNEEKIKDKISSNLTIIYICINIFVIINNSSLIVRVNNAVRFITENFFSNGIFFAAV